MAFRLSALGDPRIGRAVYYIGELYEYMKGKRQTVTEIFVHPDDPREVFRITYEGKSTDVYRYEISLEGEDFP